MGRMLERIGIGKAGSLLACDASFKGVSRFDVRRTGAPGDSCFHPFAAPVDGDPHDVVTAWHDAGDRSFADAVGAQPRACALDPAPRQRSMPGYAGSLNHAYHLDAGKLAAPLAAHAMERLGVRHVRDHVVVVETAESGNIAAVRTRGNGTIPGDLFIDRAGHAALLVGERPGVPFVDRSGEAPNDRAPAVQIPVAPAARSRRRPTPPRTPRAGSGTPACRPGGVGCVYASAFATDDEAAATLEASAIVLVELSLNALLDNLPDSALPDRPTGGQHGAQAGAHRHGLAADRLAPDRRGGRNAPVRSGCSPDPVSRDDRRAAWRARRGDRAISAGMFNARLAARRRWAHVRRRLPAAPPRRPAVQQMMMRQGIVPQSYHPIAPKLGDEELTRL